MKAIIEAVKKNGGEFTAGKRAGLWSKYYPEPLTFTFPTANHQARVRKMISEHHRNWLEIVGIDTEFTGKKIVFRTHEHAGGPYAETGSNPKKLAEALIQEMITHAVRMGVKDVTPREKPPWART